MNTRWMILGLAGLIVGSAGLAPATDDDATREATTKSAAPKIDDQTEREARLAKQLTGAVLRGSFQMTNAEGLEGKAPMTKPSVERYEIAAATKIGDDFWTITARIQYADRDVNVPVPVRIKWAAGTPIITLDKMNIPLIGQYSARVVIDDGFYGGTWRGPTYGGVLSGQILRKEDVAKIEQMEREGWKMTMPGKRNDESESDPSQQNKKLNKDVLERPQSRGTKASPIDMTNTRTDLDIRQFENQYIVIEGIAEYPGKGCPWVRFPGQDPNVDNTILVNLTSPSWPERALNRRVRVTGRVRIYEKVVRPATEPVYQEYTEGLDVLEVDHWELVSRSGD